MVIKKHQSNSKLEYNKLFSEVTEEDMEKWPDLTKEEIVKKKEKSMQFFVMIIT